jgi:hypothetical protein
MPKFPKPPTSQKSLKGKGTSGVNPGKKSAMHGDNSKLGMKGSRKSGGK